MLPKRLRLSRRSFPAPRSGSRLQSDHFSLMLGPSKDGGAAAVVSKAVAKRSVDRHTLKRLMLEVMRPYVRADRYLVAYARLGAPALSFKELSDELSGLLTRTIVP